MRRRVAAKEYMRPGSLKLTAQNEQYLYNTVDRIEKETSSGGGSSSGGSTTHTSSSGTTHGGSSWKVLEVPHMTDVKKVIRFEPSSCTDAG